VIDLELDEIKKILEQNFNKELSEGKKRNIIFWYDDNGEFEDQIDSLELSAAKLLKLDGKNYFYAKYLLEKQDTESNYLVYAPFSKPSPRENWLLDILKYNEEFYADRITVIMRNLGVKNEALRSVFQHYRKFFSNKERNKLLKSYNLDYPNEESVHIAILSALCKLPYSSLDEVVKSLLIEYAQDGNTYFNEINKFGDIDAFWMLIEKYYGYILEEKTIEHLSVFFLITGLYYNLEEKIPPQWERFVSPKKADCFVFLSNFMNNSKAMDYFDMLSIKVEKQLNLQNYIDSWHMDNYVVSDVFKIFDEAIIDKLIKNLISDAGEFDRYKDIILERRTKHWYRIYENEYNCIYWSSVLLDSWKKIKDNIKEDEPYELFQKYVGQYYIIDMAYRKFIYFFDKLTSKEQFFELREKVENTYVNGYLNQLSIKWSDSLETLGQNWQIPSLEPQQDFYIKHVKPYEEKDERVVVIISDGLRYEAAKELQENLNTERNGSTEITSMLGILPSYTALGMAALLPHNEIEVDEKFQVIVDGFSSDGLENRNKILQKAQKDSVAVRYEQLSNMKRDDFRKLFGGKKVIYIYHKIIDARGDGAHTENEVFNAVEEAFTEIKTLINDLINNISATNIYITADHGFIYKRGNIQESDKVPKESLEDSLQNRRFILTEKDVDLEGAIIFNMNHIKNTRLKCIVPRGVNRFKAQGEGANYVHGGAALQEVVIPVVKFKNERGKNAKEVKKVDVKLTSISRKITNNITYLEFFQVEKIQDKTVPRRLLVYLADEKGNRVSNENIIIADSKSDNPEERTFKEKFILKSTKYDKNSKYYLVLEDEEETVENIYEKIPFIIDIAFTDDFDF